MGRDELLAELLIERFGRLEDLELELPGGPVWLLEQKRRTAAALRRHGRRAA